MKKPKTARKFRSPECLAAIQHPGAGRMRHKGDRRPKDARRTKEDFS